MNSQVAKDNKGGQIGTGPFFKDIGGKGMALTIFALTFTAFFN